MERKAGSRKEKDSREEKFSKLLERKLYVYKALNNVVEWIGKRYNRSDMEVSGVRSFNDKAYGQHKKQRLDIHVPADAKGKLPCIVLIHGGGWATMDKSFYAGYAKRLARLNFVVCNVNYRLTPEAQYPEILSDVVSAYNYIYTKAHYYHIDTQKFVLMGDSAGAYLAAMLAGLKLSGAHQFGAIAGSISDISCIVSYYGAFNLETIENTHFQYIEMLLDAFLGKDRDNESCKRMLSPIQYVTPEFPPVFLSAGKVDRLYPQSVEFWKALQENHVDCELLSFDETEKRAGHAYMAKPAMACTARTLRKSLDFAKQKTNGRDKSDATDEG